MKLVFGVTYDSGAYFQYETVDDGTAELSQFEEAKALFLETIQKLYKGDLNSLQITVQDTVINVAKTSAITVEIVDD